MESKNKSVQNVDDCEKAWYVVSEIDDQLMNVCRAYGGEGWREWYTEEMREAGKYSITTGKLMIEVLRLRIKSIIENKGKVY